MSYVLCAIAMILAVLPLSAANAAVSVSIGQPGFYGRIDIGDAPTPLLIYPEPIVIRPAVRSVPVQPLYLLVPPGHERNWHKHCSRYNACGHPVYFVQDHWYNNVYVPHYRERGPYHAPRYYRERDDGHAWGRYREHDDDRARMRYRERVRDYERGDDRKWGGHPGKHYGQGGGWGHPGRGWGHQEHGQGRQGHGRGHGKD